MSADDWGVGWNDDPYWENDLGLEEDPEWGHDPDWVEDQQEIELAFDILVHTSDKAHLLQFGERDVWFPKSKATINMSMHNNTVRVPKWLMFEKNLEEYCTDESEETTKIEELFSKVMRKNIKSLEDDIPF
jgi:hypothetical protein